MKKYQQDLIRLIIDSSVDPDAQAKTALSELSARDLANIFVDVSFLITGLNFIKEQYWLESKKRDNDENVINFANFIKKFFKAELRPLLFFHATLETASIEQTEIFLNNAHFIQKSVINCAKEKVFPLNHEFAVTTLTLMSELFEFEYQAVMKKNELNQNLGYSLYRTFDIMDEFFNLSFNSENSVIQDPNCIEKIYPNSGVAVQSSYSGLLLALRYLRIPTGSQFIDLGSGFGRVGLVVGLLRPDIRFTGYEFVNHRVDIANSASKSLGLNPQVNFITQDLAAKDFLIPAAETYYLYDPFSEETYKYVIEQLNVIAARKKIAVITKGNAKLQFMQNTQNRIWSKPQEFDTGNFCLFRSY